MKLLEKFRALSADIQRIKAQNHDLRLQIGTMLVKQTSSATTFQDAEFKVFSQFGDDGIIQYLIKNVNPTVNKFIEFGVENYEESNTRFLLINNYWQGLVIDGSDTNIDYIKKDPIYWRHNLTAVNSFITAENINDLIKENGYANSAGLLSIDIDGNDYWVWKAITAVTPDIVIVEYNAIFGPDRPITIPYEAGFVRTNAHYSNLYRGASLAALYNLAIEKGYSFVGCNSAGNNAYFIKTTKLGPLGTLTPLEGFVQSHFRESRHSDGTLSFADLDEQRKLISGLPVFNVITKQIEVF
ncbi:hypothetical protein GO755_05955 [Spirosoma sp. HMF4905]|uniref:Uncharacterized protein n=1 Tax=Spirosoma arboris TaxID=2682092 RepID=A0A7K1S7I4_9BACT|nr:hypothetical protein [Spirosoma arboris]MVM29568.1 hypothetical protein [Spirosoma arboris]